MVPSLHSAFGLGWQGATLGPLIYIIAFSAVNVYSGGLQERGEIVRLPSDISSHFSSFRFQPV